jgi:sec-independent protein translocase protein TatB
VAAAYTGGVFGIGPEKFIVIAVIAMVLLGPDKLPSAARTVGGLMHQFRQIQANLRAEMENAMRLPDATAPDAPPADQGD